MTRAQSTPARMLGLGTRAGCRPCSPPHRACGRVCQALRIRRTVTETLIASTIAAITRGNPRPRHARRQARALRSGYCRMPRGPRARRVRGGQGPGVTPGGAGLSLSSLGAPWRRSRRCDGMLTFGSVRRVPGGVMVQGQEGQRGVERGGGVRGADAGWRRMSWRIGCLKPIVVRAVRSECWYQACILHTALEEENNHACHSRSLVGVVY